MAREDRLRILLAVEGDGQVRATLSGVRTALSQTQASVITLNQALDLMARVSRTAVAAFQQYGAYADKAALLAARVRLATTNQEEFVRVQQRLFEMSNRIGVGLEETATLYTRLARSSGELGVSQNDLLRVTETINKAIIVSGANAQEASAGLIQFAQGLASGALRGDELRSVLEQMPVLAQIIAKEFNVSVGQLRDLGKEGALTADRIIKALLEAGPEIDRQFSQIPETVGRAFQALENTVIAAFGAIDKGTGTSRELVGVIHDLAQAVEENLPLFEALATGLGLSARAAAELVRGGLDIVTTFGEWIGVVKTASDEGARYEEIIRKAAASSDTAKIAIEAMGPGAAQAAAVALLRLHGDAGEAAAALAELAQQSLSAKTALEILASGFGTVEDKIRAVKEAGGDTASQIEALQTQLRAALAEPGHERAAQLLRDAILKLRLELGETSKAAQDVKQVQAELEKKFADVAKNASYLGDTFDVNKAKMKALEEALEQLRDKGVSPTEPAVASLRAQLNDLASADDRAREAARAHKEERRDEKKELAELNREYEKAIEAVRERVEAEDELKKMIAGSEREATLAVMDEAARRRQEYEYETQDRLAALEEQAKDAGKLEAERTEILRAETERRARIWNAEAARAKRTSTVVADAFEDMISGIAAGTQELSLEGISDAFKAAFAASVKEKLSFDKIFRGNIFELLGDIEGALTGSGGLADAFGDLFQGIVGQKGQMDSALSSLMGGGGAGGAGEQAGMVLPPGYSVAGPGTPITPEEWAIMYPNRPYPGGGGGGLGAGIFGRYYGGATTVALASGLGGYLGGRVGGTGGAIAGSLLGTYLSGGNLYGGVGGLAGGYIGGQLGGNTGAVIGNVVGTYLATQYGPTIASAVLSQIGVGAGGAAGTGAAGAGAAGAGAGAGIGTVAGYASLYAAAAVIVDQLIQASGALQASSPAIRGFAGWSQGIVRPQHVTDFLNVLSGDFDKLDFKKTITSTGLDLLLPGLSGFLSAFNRPSRGQMARRGLGGVLEDIPELEEFDLNLSKYDKFAQLASGAFRQVPGLAREAKEELFALSAVIAEIVPAKGVSELAEIEYVMSTLLYNLGKAGTSSTDVLDIVAKSLVQVGVTGEDVGDAINSAFARAHSQLRPGDYDRLVGMFNRLGLSIYDMRRALPGIIEAMNRELDRLGSEVFEAIFGEDALKQWFPTFQRIFAKLRSLGIESFEEIGELGPDVLEAKIRALGPAAEEIFDALREHGVGSMRDLLTLAAEAQSEDEKVAEAAKARLEAFGSAIADAFSELTQRAEAFRQVAESLKGTINSLVIGPESALPLTEQLDYLLRQADLIRSKLAQAKPEEQPALMQELSDTLQRLLGLGIFQTPSLEFADLFNQILAELEDLRARSERMAEAFAPTPAQHGFSGWVTRPRLFLAGEAGPEFVSITPGGHRARGPLEIQVAPVFNVNVNGTAHPDMDGRAFAVAAEDAILRSIRSGRIREAIKEVAA